MHNDDPLALLDDVREHAQSRRDALVVPRAARRGVDIDRAAAGLPADVRSVDSVLNLVDAAD